jgi:hypothetical protein
MALSHGAIPPAMSLRGASERVVGGRLLPDGFFTVANLVLARDADHGTTCSRTSMASPRTVASSSRRSAADGAGWPDLDTL